LTGTVDAEGRSPLTIELRHPAGGPATPIVAWVDTAFSADLVLPQSQIASLSLPVAQTVRSVLGDGSAVELNTFRADLDWFGARRPIEVIANDGRFPLLGVGLLRGRILHIDYAAGTLTLD
jgi:predicted aspartyl protease